MGKTALKILLAGVLVVLFFKPLSAIKSDSDHVDVQLLNSLNFFASLYTSQENTVPSRFSDFVDFSQSDESSSNNLNINSFNNYLDKSKKIDGFNSNKMTIYFDKGFSNNKGTTYILIDGKVFIDSTIPVATTI